MFFCRSNLLKNKKKERKNRITHMTMMVIPHSQGTPVKSYCFPMWAVRSFLCVSCACILTVGYFVAGFFYLNYVAAENEQLKEINTAQAAEITELKGMAGTMRNKLEDLIKLDEEVRAKVGLTKAAKDQKNERMVDGSRSMARYQFMTMGLNVVDENQRQQQFAVSMIPYVSPEGMGTGGAEQVLELPKADGELDSLEELKVELARMDVALTQQMGNMTQLSQDVDKQLAYQKALPDRWPFSGRLSSGFGWRKNPFTKKGSEFHEGIDIAGPYGSAITAAGDGVVTFAGWKSGFGRMILISHGYGYVTQYGHNSSLLVKSGDRVEKGQVIARLGNTGRSTGPHLHFGVAQNGKWINPLNVLKQ